MKSIIKQDRSSKRLPAEIRSAQILQAAKQLLDRKGIHGFSLEGVAREAAVAASLPRHYFGSSIELLAAATVDVIKEVESILRPPHRDLLLASRISQYLDIIRRYPWAHQVWMRAEEIDPSVLAIVQRSRVRMGEAIMGKTWTAMNEKEKLLARGCTGFVEAIVSEWIDTDSQDMDTVLETLLEWLSRIPHEGYSSATIEIEHRSR